MSLKTKTTVRGNGYEIDIELRCRAERGRETAALDRAGRLRETIEEVVDP